MERPLVVRKRGCGNFQIIYSEMRGYEYEGIKGLGLWVFPLYWVTKMRILEFWARKREPGISEARGAAAQVGVRRNKGIHNSRDRDYSL